jgi:muramoyltetrapeptide carboxypeptidase
MFTVKQGDTLGICAPSGKFDAHALEKGIDVLKSLGFNISVHQDIFKQKRYLAGDDSLRANMINRLFSDPEIKAIICARGGYGALRILKFIDWNIIRQNPRPFIGYSDITALLTAIVNETGMPVIHGPTAVSLANADKQTLDSFFLTLTGAQTSISVPEGRVIRDGIAEGMLTGGNLATLSHLLGTRFQPVFRDAILFFEDIGEPLYKIDRMLSHMKLAGLFDNIRGVITGSFEKCDDSSNIEEIVEEIFDEYQIPILSGLSAGHGKTNLSMVFGKTVRLDTMNMALEWIQDYKS